MRCQNGMNEIVALGLLALYRSFLKNKRKLSKNEIVNLIMSK